jgi:hypothetical protein
LIRTLNSTGRQRITMDMVSATPRIEGASRSIDLVWNLAELTLDKKSDVIIEVSITGQTMRIVSGQLAEGTGSHQAKVPFLVDAKSAKVKILVSMANESGIRMISATSTSIPVLFEKEPEGGQSPLPIQLKEDLKTVWELDYSTGKPVLWITNKNGIYGQLKSNPIFFPTILPQVIKEISFQMLSNPSAFESNSEVWVNFFRGLGLSDEERADLQAMEDIEEGTQDRWDKAEALSSEFSVRLKVLSKIEAALEEES